MILYVNGDSHSAGHDAGGPEHSYGKHLADHLDMQFVCDALPGCSNDSIIARTMKYIEHTHPDLLIIGWSTWERETWWHNDHAYNITASGTDTVHPELVDKYKQWVIDSCSPEFQNRVEDRNHRNIWALHQELQDRNIKHLFFNCFSHFFYTSAHNRPRYVWGNNYIDPYDQNCTYYYWLKHNDYTPANPNFYHYGPDAHIAWSKFLLSHITKL